MAIKDAVREVYDRAISDAGASTAALEAERDELRAEVERLRTTTTMWEEYFDDDNAEARIVEIDELKQQLAAARDGSLQAVFDAVVRYRFHTEHINDDDSVDKLDEVTGSATYYNSSSAADVLRSFAATNTLSTAVLDELWSDHETQT